MHALSPPQRHAAWSLRIQEAEYSALLPTLARIPTALGYAVARWRGRFNARFDRDWVSLALGHRHVARRATPSFCPRHSSQRRWSSVLKPPPGKNMSRACWSDAAWAPFVLMQGLRCLNWPRGRVIEVWCL